MSRRLSFIFAVCMLTPTLANALNVSTLPDGMCALDTKIPEHAVVLTYLNGSRTSGNELVASFASCDELKAIADKKATSISHYGSILKQTPLADITIDRPTYLATIAKTFESTAALTQTAIAGATSAAAQGASASGIATPTSIGAVSKGVLYQDPRMVIIGMEQTNQLGTQTTKVASTAAMTMLSGAPISVNLYAPLTDKEAFAKSTERLKPIINRMVRENQ